MPDQRPYNTLHKVYKSIFDYLWLYSDWTPLSACILESYWSPQLGMSVCNRTLISNVGLLDVYDQAFSSLMGL